MSRYKEDDINLLLPTWRAKVAELLARMKALGFKPVLFDGLRTSSEAAHNAATGKGIADSMHCYGVAADIICDDHGWSCAANKCKFYTNLVREALAMKLVSGSTFKDRLGRPKCDMPHVQGVSIRQERAVRSLGAGPESADARDACVRAFFGTAG